MEMAPLIISTAALAAAGLIGGLLAGLLGVGGGIVIVPVLYNVLVALGYTAGISIKIAVATSLATIIATSVSSVQSHNRRGAVIWPVVYAWVAPVVFGVVCGSLIGGYVDGRWLSAIFAFVAIGVAIRSIISRGVPDGDGSFPSRAVRTIAGVFVGLVSTLMGIGGGTLSVPIFTAFNFSVRKAVGTASAIGLIIALPATVGYILTGLNAPGRPPYSLGFVNLPAALILLPLTWLMAPLGARIAHSINQRTLTLNFALFLTIAAAKMIFDLLGGTGLF